MRKLRPVNDAMLAFSQLTAMPVVARWPTDGERPDVAGWYPSVGLALGAGAYALAAAVVILAPGAQMIAAAIALVFLALATRALHWDGVADVADAWFAPEMERRHAILKDSATGAFGTVAIVLVALLQAGSIATLATARHAVVIVVAVCFGRMAATFSAWLGTAARPTGLGASVVRRPGVSGLTGFALAVFAVASIGWLVIFPGMGLVAVEAIFAVGLLGALVVPHVISGRFGGVTGDTMGASVMVVETLVLVVGALVMAS